MGWRKPANVDMMKVKAHPERRNEEWDRDNEGIWIADRVAGGEERVDYRIKASQILLEVA